MDIDHHFTERIIGVGIYAIIAVAFYLILCRDNIRIKRTLYMYAIILSSLAYFFIPATVTDLYRLWITAESYNRFPIMQMVQEIFNGWSSPLGLVYVCIVSKINPHLLPAITSMLFYYNVFYIIADYSEKHYISNRVVALVTFLYMSTGVYGEVISGIRSLLAFSFIARCCYNEIYNDKSILKNLPIYILAALFHQGAMVLVVLRFAAKILFDEKGMKRIAYLLLLGVVVLVFYNRYESLVQKVMRNAESYLTTGGFSYIWEFVFNTIFAVITLLIFYYTSRNQTISTQSIKMRKFVMLIFAVCIVSINSYSIYHRFILFSSMIALPVFLEVVGERERRTNEYSLSRNNKFITGNNLLMMSFVILFLSCLKGNLNGIRFFTL